MTAIDPSIEILLSEDHLAIDALFEAYLETKKTNPLGALGAFQNYAIALLSHIKCEEEAVFPTLVRFPEERASQEIPTLLDEHQIIQGLLHEVKETLETGTDPSSRERRLFEELHEHNAREEMYVYPPLDRLLSQPEKNRIVESIRTHGL